MSALEAVHEPPPTAGRAAQALYERHASRIYAFCRRRLGSPQEAEDAVQTTFLYAFRALQRGVAPVSEQAWLYKIAGNVCLNVYRANGRRSEREVPGGAELVELAPARDSGGDALVGLDLALDAIPARQRDVFVLRELRGLSYREIAQSLDVSVGAVETLVFRARRSLARALENGAGLRGRVASVFDLGAALNMLKTAAGGASVAKIVSAAAVVAIATLPAGDAPRERAARMSVAAATTPAGASSLSTARRGSTDGTGRAAAREQAGLRARVASRADARAISGGHAGTGRLERETPAADEPSNGSGPGSPQGPASPLRPIAPQQPALPTIDAPPPPLQIRLPNAPPVPDLSLPTVPIEVSEPSLPAVPGELVQPPALP